MEPDQLSALLRARTPKPLDMVPRWAMLVPLVEGPGGPALLYEVRALKLRRQPGEVCFPGGRMEAGESPEDCALRETEEELGLPRQTVRVLGPLDYIAHRSDALLCPFLALADAGTRLVPNPAEVEAVLRVPLDDLRRTPPLSCSYPLLPPPGEDFPYEALGISPDYPWQAGREEFPAYRWRGRVIWGMTGRITRHVLSLLP